MVECSNCGEEFRPEESEALDSDKFCTPECEGDYLEDEDNFDVELEEEEDGSI